MYKEKTIAVVIPAFNEETLIGKTLDSVPSYVDKIVVVDDASRDQTAEIVERVITQQPDRVVLIRHKANQGVGGAIASGYMWCRDNRIEAAAVMAGDAQMDPTDLPSLLDPVVNGEVDYAKGNRLLSGEAWQKIPRTRYLGNAAMSFLTKIVSGYWHVADSQCGYTVIGRQALNTIQWEHMFKRYGQPNDLLVRMNINNFSVKDVVVKPIYGVGEKSGIKPLRMIPKLGLLLARLFIMRMVEKYVIRDFHPLILFYFLAFFLLLISLPLFFRALWIWYSEGVIPSINFLAWMFTCIMGTQSLLFAMLFDMQYNKNLR